MASEKLFYFDPKIRSKIRGDLNLSNRIVVIYAGALLAKWHIPDIMFGLFKDWCQRDSKIHILIVTTDQALAHKFTDYYHLSSSDITIKTATHSEVPQYMMAADIGILIRQPHPLNRVASPTKFAEYLMTGLSVLVSTGIGDSDEIIQQYGFGAIVENLEDKDHIWSHFHTLTESRITDLNRYQKASVTAAIYSAEKALAKRIEIYTSFKSI